MSQEKKYFHLEKVFSNRDVNGNVYSYLIITCNKNGESLACWDQGKNGSYFLSKFFGTYGNWTETESWEPIREFNRQAKSLESGSTDFYLTEDKILAWLKKNHRIRKVKTNKAKKEEMLTSFLAGLLMDRDRQTHQEMDSEQKRLIRFALNFGRVYNS